MISKRLRLLKDNFLGIRITDRWIVFGYVIPRDDPMLVFHRRRIVHKKLAVVFEIGMKGKSNQTFFVAHATDFLANVKKDFRCRRFSIILKNVNDSALFNHEQSIVASVTQMNRTIETQFGKRILEPNTLLHICRQSIRFSLCEHINRAAKNTSRQNTKKKLSHRFKSRVKFIGQTGVIIA